MKTLLLMMVLSAWALSGWGQPRITERALADVAVIAVPAALDNEQTGFYGSDEAGRLTFGFSSTHLWASMGSTTTYKQQLIVSLMAPDASDADYAAVPRRMNIGYEGRKPLGRNAVATGTLTTSEGLYTRGSFSEPSYQFVYADRSRRLQLVWRAVKKQVDLETGVAQIARMAATFRIVRDPVAQFAQMREAPRKEAALRASKLVTVQAMLQREGYAALVPGKPVLRNGVYLEWMSDPEPRYQLLLPLGRVRAAPNGSVVLRPRPVKSPSGGGPTAQTTACTLGWREVSDGDWVYSNLQHDYLPFKGTAALLAAQQQDRAYVYFYCAATVRVEETSEPELLTSLRWFLDGLPEV